jgi:hypothetical protein
MNLTWRVGWAKANQRTPTPNLPLKEGEGEGASAAFAHPTC